MFVNINWLLHLKCYRCYKCVECITNVIGHLCLLRHVLRRRLLLLSQMSAHFAFAPMPPLSSPSPSSTASSLSPCLRLKICWPLITQFWSLLPASLTSTSLLREDITKKRKYFGHCPKEGGGGNNPKVLILFTKNQHNFHFYKDYHHLYLVLQYALVEVCWYKVC